MKKFILYALSTILLMLLLVAALLYQPDIALEKLEAQYANAQSRYLDWRGIRVHYRIEGQGPDLLLLHGTAASLHTWDDWTDRLQDSFRIIRMDLPAFGLTGPHPDRDYSLAAYVGFLEDFASQLGLDSFYLAGNSLGGAIAWHYTLDHPERVKKLILIDPSGLPHPERAPPLVFRLGQNPVSAWFLKRILPRSIIRSNLEEVYHNDALVDTALVNRYHRMALRPGNRQAFVDRTRVQFSDRSGELRRINCPVLIQWGRYDAWIPLEDGLYFRERIPRSKLLIYDEAGHVPMEEIPEETAKDAAAFLNDYSPAEE